MELLPIIYNSLLIAAGLFVVTVAISYISYKIKKDKGLIEETEKPEEYKSVFKQKRKVEEELRPHHRTRHPKPTPKPVKKEEKKVAKKEAPPKRREPEIIKQRKPEPKPKSRKDSNSTKRIERVTELLPSNERGDQEQERVEKRNEKTKNVKNKKNLKSINDDPLKKYTDSAEDDLHPLKTDE